MQKRGLIVFSLILFMSFVLLASVFAQDTTNPNVVENNLPVEVPENTLASSVGYVSPDEIPESELESDLTEDEEVNVLVKEAEGFTGELNEKAGITPDSGLYFVEDKILAPFISDLDNRERKIAEMQIMVSEGKIDEAKKSFERYQGYARNFERDVSPEERDEALSSSERIRGTFVKEIVGNLPPEQRGEYIS